MPRKQSGRAPVLVHFINPLRFPHGRTFVWRAVRAARRPRRLKRLLKSQGAPVIYANDHLGGLANSAA